MTFIYNPSLSSSGAAHLTAACEVFDAKGQRTIDTPMSSFCAVSLGSVANPPERSDPQSIDPVGDLSATCNAQ